VLTYAHTFFITGGGNPNKTPAWEKELEEYLPYIAAGILVVGVIVVAVKVQ